ncbi:DsbA family oxidoreductase [Cryobacterium sp. PH31-O1]|uniref:DsbA family oxidoreductase n=1 Tax=Cryobacterium sp. PH31-O1 TaxID=3046306 RepID=UPI0024BB8FD5|nr:DsbA family oxidoreductase [Cryobacterium sp. PH31-O1]MDJ0338779.1 DsbA family oxidoreductase [Cryobacterium sp. PH31-O1]
MTDTNTTSKTAPTTSTLTSADPIKVDIWSDVQCPWCYIGKRKFEAGVELFDGTVEVEYHSFELSPDTPVDYVGNAVDYLSERKGMPVDEVQKMLENVTAIAASVGLDYDYDSVHQTNTVISHELLHYAKAHGRQLDMKERLLKAYFIDGRHVGRIQDLADLAAEIGLDRDDVVRSLTEHEHLSAVKADVAQAGAYGIQGVPFFVIDGRYGISGAQDPTTFAQALNQVRADRTADRLADGSANDNSAA